MATDTVLCNKPCSLKNADGSYTEGIMYVYKSLVRFMPKGGGAKKLDVAVADIKGQKRSKTSPLVMFETETMGKPVFKFNSAEERDEVNAAIVQAQVAAKQPAAAAAGAAGTAPLAAAPSGVADAARSQGAVQLVQQLPPEQRRELLASNSKLADQYKALVVSSKALTEDEFWTSAAVLKVAGLAGQPTTSARASKRGLANRLVDLARQHQAAGGDGKLTKVIMSFDDEQQLLAEKPALKQIYDAQVGTIMTKEEFWNRYFRYYMAKGVKRGGAMQRFKQLQQNLMAESAAAVADMTGNEQQEMADLELSALFSVLDTNSRLDEGTRTALRRKLNPAVDLAAAAEDKLTADGYGLAHNASRSELEQVQGYSALSEQLAQDYNVHAAAVMGHVAPPPAGATGASSSRAAAAAGQPGAEVMSERSEDDIRRFRQQAGSGLDDLSAPVQPQFEQLQVTNPRLYFSNIQQQQQPQQAQQQQRQQGSGVKQEPGGQQSQAQPQDVLLLLRGVDPNDLTERPIEPQATKMVLHELCGGAVADAARRGGPRSLPQAQLDFMQQQVMVVDELLRHFWSQIPCNTPEREAKIKRIQQSLDDTYKLLNKTLEECSGPQKAPLGRLIKPLRDQMEAAGAAYGAIMKALAGKQQQRSRPQQQAQQ